MYVLLRLSSRRIKIFLSIRRSTYSDKVEKMINITNSAAGFDVPLQKNNIGQLIIPQDVLKDNHDLKRYANYISAHLA